jgi:hypothetical protein
VGEIVTIMLSLSLLPPVQFRSMPEDLLMTAPEAGAVSVKLEGATTDRFIAGTFEEPLTVQLCVEVPSNCRSESVVDEVPEKEL